MVESLLKVLGAGLSIWASKEKTKYVDKYLRLQREYYEENNKHISDDAVLDNIRFDLELLSSAFSSKIGATYPQDK